MSFLLHEKAKVVCLHTGQAKPMVTDQRVKVSGNKVAIKLPLYTISGCTLPPPIAGNGPCVTAKWMTAARRVKASGQAVLLSDSKATCAPSGTGIKIVLTQRRVKGT
jgi:hypothetical protein